MIGVSHVLRVVVNTVAAAAVEVGVYGPSSSKERADGVGRRPWQAAAGRDQHGAAYFSLRSSVPIHVTLANDVNHTMPGEVSVESHVAADEQNSIAGGRPKDTVAVHNHDLRVGCGSDIA